MGVEMKVNAGLWIDHLKAIIVVTFEGGEKTLEIQSHVEAQASWPEDVRGLGAVETVQARAADGRQRAYVSQLNRFYTEVIGAIRDAEAILIFGPGAAKEELAGHLGRARLGDLVVGVDRAERMTVAQITTRIRQHFSPALTQGEVA